MSTLRRYWFWILGLLAIEVWSLKVFWWSNGVAVQPTMMTIAYALIVLVGLWLAFKRPTWLAWATLAELVIGGKGYLFWTVVDGEKISIRMALFLLLMIAAFWQTAKSKHVEFPKTLRWPIALLLLWVIAMSAVGLMRGFGSAAVWADMNAYLYLAIIWPWWIFFRRHPQWQKFALVIVLAGATMIGFKSWLMQLLFAQNIQSTEILYAWIRQTGIGEITLISKNVYRIFFQGQIYALLGFIIAFIGYVRHYHRPWWGVAALGSSLGVYLSLSRSLWLGLAVAVGIFAVMEIHRRQWLSLRRFLILLPLSVFVWMMATWAINFPYIITPPGRTSNADAVVARLKSAGSTQASTARANQIPPLLTAIRSNPITGQGFGATIMYYSTDPRIKGNRTTSAFELGYLDMLFHFGLIGLALFGWWLWIVWQRLRTNPAYAIWLWPTVGLVAVHLTTPYLNHPLGLGWLALVSLIAFDHE
jgi:hypothetical protein